MAPRLELQNLLEALLGSRNVYFQPPENIQMNYPAIVYYRDRIAAEYGDNISYLKNNRYHVAHIDRSPDSEVPDKLAGLPMSSHSAAYTADNLNHNVFSIYY